MYWLSQELNYGFLEEAGRIIHLLEEKNVHRIDDRVPFAETLNYMENARICLNVMPWFKAGTHDRIFNTLLRYSLPLTDSSSWLDCNFKNGEDIAIYDLEHLERLPGQVERLLRDGEQTMKMIQKGYEKVAGQFVWKNCVDQILRKINM